ncbi:MAG: hypothetical protein CVU56_19130 [Deltaproteobacteria bacterium HGW-Deltaproteobacteria-14]|jgi:hypothetical protein|nr:MAG: hypothetical protein CVU56_19130 [Deltaproteobacteria bacterium HGW-Deltaproteobacteria-14]
MASRVPPISTLALIALASLAACGDDGATSAVRLDTTVGADVVGADVTAPSDTVRPGLDTVAVGTDVGPAALVGLKDDPDWIVPGGVVARTAVAVAGTRVAWVEAPADANPELVVWDTALPDTAPVAYRVPNLAHPRELALGDAALVYVDDRYGDADLFAVDLASGAEQALVTRPGAQEHPTLVGAALAWADCRACVSGDGGGGREIFRRALDGVEQRVTSDAVADDRPTLGTLADGTLALAWVNGDTQIRVVGVGTDATLDTGRSVAGVALTQGVIAFRPPPLIINPDSMRPTDLRLWNVASGEVRAATFHAELAPGMDPVPRAADGRFAWIDGVPGAPAQAQLTVADPEGAADLTASVAGAVTAAVSGARVAILAPRADNDGLLDLWIRELP